MPLTPQDLASGNYSAAVSAATDATGTTQLVFDAKAVAGDASQAYGTATDLLNTFDQTKVDLTGDQAKAQTAKIIQGLQLIPGAGQIIGGALYAITQAGGFAHAGVGVCGTNPPKGPGLGDLKAWPNYTPWQQSSSNSAPAGLSWVPGSDPHGSFEEIANNTLAYNAALGDNCFGSLMVPFPLLLSQIVAAWNGTHSGPPRTISRKMINGNIGSTAPGYDPIALALEIAGGYNAMGKTMSLVVNGGPVIPKAAILHLRLSPHTIVTSKDGLTFSTSTVSSAGSTAKTVAVVAAIGVGSIAAGLGIYALATHQSFMGVLKGLCGSTGKRIVRKVNPLPARESRSTTVQTLLFPRPRYSEARAKAWAHAKGFAAPKTDITENYIRIRQKPPSQFKSGSFRTITLGKSGVRAVVGHLR